MNQQVAGLPANLYCARPFTQPRRERTSVHRSEGSGFPRPATTLSFGPGGSVRLKRLMRLKGGSVRLKRIMRLKGPDSLLPVRIHQITAHTPAPYAVAKTQVSKASHHGRGQASH